MPTYEYECTKCGKVFELFQSIRESAKKRVPVEVKACLCNAEVRRLIGGGAGLIFKGSGFYQTDYRSESYKQAAKAETEAAAPKDSETKTKKDKTTKPEEKSESSKRNKGDKSKASTAAA